MCLPRLHHVDVLQFAPTGSVLCVRPYCRNEHYWQVYFATNRLIGETFGEAGLLKPGPAGAGSRPVQAASVRALSR